MDQQIMKSFVNLGKALKTILSRQNGEQNDGNGQKFSTLLHLAQQKNQWFTPENVKNALNEIASQLTQNNLEAWHSVYHDEIKKKSFPKKIGVINAGNIPFVGFHDLMCVLMSGNIYYGKNSFGDPYLLPFIAEKLFEIDPLLKEKIFFVERMTDVDAVIATGSNNSSRYFEYYFGKYPHIIRRNRNAVAVINGDETKEALELLGKDIFQYFGLGCRNVSKIFVPRNYNFNNFFEAVFSFSSVMQHNKYMNNYDYNRTILLMKQVPFFENNFLIIKEDKAIASPVAVLHYEFYEDEKTLKENLQQHREEIQCIVGKDFIPFGNAQCPALSDYADGIDTMQFLLQLPR